MMLNSVTTVLLSAWFSAAALPADPRLGAVKARMQVVVDEAERERLPVELLLSKMREGLAKRVPPPLIAAAVERLVVALREARTLAQTRSAHPPSARLLQAIAEARLAHVAEEPLRRVLAARGNEAIHQLAIESLADLKLRGCEPETAIPVVEALMVKDPRSLSLLPSLIQSLRQDFALTSAEATFSVETSLKSERSLQSAAVRARSDNAAGGKGAAHTDGLNDDGANRGRGVQSNPGKGKANGRGKP